MKKELDNINVKLLLSSFGSWLSIVFASYYVRIECQTAQAKTKEWWLSTELLLIHEITTHILNRITILHYWDILLIKRSTSWLTQ